MNTFIVANGLNTSYIDSLLVALFYKSSHIEEMISQDPEDSKFVYLQELINTNFIEPIRKNFSIDSAIINELRNVSLICGWKNCGNLVDLYNVSDYIKFLMKGIGYGGINLELIEYNGRENEILKAFDTLCLDVDVKENTNIKNLINEWLDGHIKTDSSGSLVYYQFREIPMLIPIYLNRKTDNGNITSCQIDIMKKIRFKKGNIKNQKMSWVIHAIVCFSNSGGGNYYSVVNTTDNNWYLFSSDRIPSFLKINITDNYIAEKIKQESVLVLYRLNDDLCKY